jgi:hypothetical protein
MRVQMHAIASALSAAHGGLAAPFVIASRLRDVDSHPNPMLRERSTKRPSQRTGMRCGRG